MTNRMAIVPVEATDGMIFDCAGALDHPSLYMGGPSQGNQRKARMTHKVLLTASPHAGKVSPDQHRAAMVALQNSKWPFMPADQRSEIIDIVIAAFGLEKAE